MLTQRCGRDGRYAATGERQHSRSASGSSRSGARTTAKTSASARLLNCLHCWRLNLEDYTASCCESKRRVALRRGPLPWDRRLPAAGGVLPHQRLHADSSASGAIRI